MAKELEHLGALRAAFSGGQYAQSIGLLTVCKLELAQAGALVPDEGISEQVLRDASKCSKMV